MNLTPENKKLGLENFHAVIGNEFTRREFLTKQVQQGVVSGGGLGPYYFGYGKSVDAPVRVGVLGTGDEGSVLIGAINPDFIQVKAVADIRPYNQWRAFHGDWYSDTAHAVRPGLLAKYDWKTEDEARKNVKVFKDYRDLIKEAKELDLEAVIIALPLHLHAPAAIAAMKAGLDVLTEKLMGHSVAECKEMARVAKQTGKHLATGHQRHYNILYENSVDLIRQGVLGELHYIRAQWHRGNLPGNDSWKQPLPPGVREDEDKDAAGKDINKLAGELKSWTRKRDEFRNKLADAEKKKQFDKAEDYKKEVEFWEARVDQKTAQVADRQIKDEAVKHGYKDGVLKDGEGKVAYTYPALEELIRWRLWGRTGGGLMAELGSHQLDAASIFISAMHGGEKQHPLCVMAAANRPLFPPDRDVEDHVYCLFEFPHPDYDPKTELGRQKKISVAYASINGSGWGGYGETVFGTQGTLVLEREKDAMLFETHNVDKNVKLARKKLKDGYQLELEVAEEPKHFDNQSAALGHMATAGAVRGYTEEIEHWAWCIRNRAPENLPRCHPKVALADAVIALTTNVAAREGKRIEFQDAWFEPDEDATPDGSTPDLSRYA